jgi:hypothetical protein
LASFGSSRTHGDLIKVRRNRGINRAAPFPPSWSPPYDRAPRVGGAGGFDIVGRHCRWDGETFQVVAMHNTTGLLVPMLKESELIGAFALFRQEVRPFTDKFRR